MLGKVSWFFYSSVNSISSKLSYSLNIWVGDYLCIRCFPRSCPLCAWINRELSDNSNYFKSSSQNLIFPTFHIAYSVVLYLFRYLGCFSSAVFAIFSSDYSISWILVKSKTKSVSFELFFYSKRGLAVNSMTDAGCLSLNSKV